MRHSVITESNKTRFKELLPPDVTYVCSRSGLMETYYYFTFQGRFVVLHWSRAIESWGAWVPTAKSLEEDGLGPVLDPSEYPEDRAFFEDECSVGRESARGLLAAVWHIVSECKEGCPKFYGVSATVIVDRLMRILRNHGVEPDEDLKKDIELLML